MKPLIAILMITLFCPFAGAEELTIVDVRKNIPLSDTEPAYKDFYLAGGSVSSLKKNMVVTAVRKTNIRDARGTQSFGEIEIPVGQLRILGVFGNVAVAREYQLLSRDENPMLEQVGLMAGDRIELKNSFIDNKPAQKPKSISETETPQIIRETASIAPASPTPPNPIDTALQPSIPATAPETQAVTTTPPTQISTNTATATTPTTPPTIPTPNPSSPSKNEAPTPTTAMTPTPPVAADTPTTPNEVN